MTQVLTTLQTLVASVAANALVVAIIRASLLLVVGLVLIRFVRALMERSLSTRLAQQQLTLARRAVTYTLFLLFLASALRELGFNFGVLLGAAGILTLAIGFASQTSVSNIISGLFIILERSIEVGDVIKVGSTTGEVIAIDLLSTKLRTFDNLLVRIPNETMIKAEITTLTRFPIRRLDLRIGVAYKVTCSRSSRCCWRWPIATR